MKKGRLQQLRYLLFLIPLALIILGFSVWEYSLYLKEFNSNIVTEGKSTIVAWYSFFIISIICSASFLFYKLPSGKTVGICRLFAAISIVFVVALHYSILMMGPPYVISELMYWPNLLFLYFPLAAYHIVKYKKVSFITALKLLPFFLIAVILSIDVIDISLIILISCMSPLLLFSLAEDKRLKGWALAGFIFIFILLSMVAIFEAEHLTDQVTTELALKPDSMEQWKKGIEGLISKTPFIGSSGNYSRESSVFSSALFQDHALNYAPLLLLYHGGALPIVILILTEIVLSALIVLCGVHSDSSIGKYMCFITAFLFIVRIILCIVTWISWPILSLSLPLQGGYLSLAVDFLLLSFSVHTAVKQFDEDSKLFDLESTNYFNLRKTVGEYMKRLMLFRRSHLGASSETPDSYSIRQETLAPKSEGETYRVMTPNSDTTSKENGKMPKTVFVTYAWKPSGPEVEKYAREVKEFVELLRAHNYDATFDLALFERYDNWHTVMIEGLKMDKIIVLLSPEYKAKADFYNGKHGSGVEFESSILTQIIKEDPKRVQLVKLESLRGVDNKEIIPICFNTGKNLIDLSKNSAIEGYNRLFSRLSDIPVVVTAPVSGTDPSINTL